MAILLLLTLDVYHANPTKLHKAIGVLNCLVGDMALISYNLILLIFLDFLIVLKLLMGPIKHVLNARRLMTWFQGNAWNNLAKYSHKCWANALII